MGNFSKWLWGIIILAIIAALIGWFAPAPLGAKANSERMGASVQAALNDGGFGWASVDMSGNVARLTGEAPSETAKIAALETAKNAQCEECADREAGRRWHEVDGSRLSVKKIIPAQIPYTLGGVLTDDGGVVLNGYVRNEEDRTRLLADAENLFPGKVTDNKIKIARGAPDLDWYGVAKTHLSGLSKLKSGEFSMTDMDSFLTGQADTEAVRAEINAALAALPAGFNGSSKIDVPNIAPVVVGQLKDENVCQDLFAELKTGKKINFAYARAEITGAPSLALLDAMARAVKQCSTFHVTVGGHTDADGPLEYNQDLSQQRADAVVAYLIANGVDAANVTAIGYGETQPIASNDTPQGMAANRRIEFKITRSK